MSENQLEHINDLIISEFAKTVELFDLNSSEARLFAILYMEGSPMTLDQMSEVLGKSKTAIGNGIRSLLELSLVERVWKRGERKDLYRADENLYRKFMTSYIQKWLNAVHSQKLSLEEIESLLEATSVNTNDSIEEVDVLFNRLKKMIAFHQLIEDTFKEIKPKNVSIENGDDVVKNK